MGGYSRIAPCAFVPKLLPKGGSVFDAEDARAEGPRQGAPAAAGRHARRHAVLRGRALRDERAATSGAQPLRLRTRTLHRATRRLTYQTLIAS